MASQPRPTPFKVSVSAGSPIVWASDTVALTKYFPAALPLGSLPPVLKVVSRRAHQRRQYPGDTSPVAQGASTGSVWREPQLANQTTPGRVFWCEEKISIGNGKFKTKRKQFTYQGSFSALKTVARATTTFNFVIRNASGAAYPVNEETP